MCVRCVFFLSFRARTERRFASCRLPPRPHQSIIIVIAIVVFTPAILSFSLSETDTVAAAGFGGGEAARCGCCGGRHRVSMQQEVRISFILARASYDIRTRRGRRGLCHTHRPYPPPPAHPTPGSVPDSSFSSLPSKGTAAFSLVGRSVGRGYGTLAFKIFRRRWRPTRAATSVSASICRETPDRDGVEYVGYAHRQENGIALPAIPDIRRPRPSSSMLNAGGAGSDEERKYTRVHRIAFRRSSVRRVVPAAFCAVIFRASTKKKNKFAVHC